MNRKRGFTLVELSIVLVIVGLLIGGILVAQSMVQTAKAQRLVKEISQYDIAIRLFKERFNAIPGDYARGSNLGSINGDGNGQIGSDYRSSTCNNGSGNEALRVWPQLQNSGLWQNKSVFSGTTTSLCTTPHCGPCQQVGVNVPESDTFKTGIGIELYYTLGISEPLGYYPRATAGYIYQLGKIDVTGLGRIETGHFMEKSFLQAIDAKLDDGVITTGNVTYNLGGGIVNNLYVPVIGTDLNN